MSDINQLQASMPPATFELISEGFMPMSEISRWTLVGGTALAIHYQHRLSEDLDFFIKNSTLEQDRKRIEKMMNLLEEKGFDVVKLQENDTQLDFEIGGVKVTFFASGLDILQKECQTFGNVNIAGIDTIRAMKMDAILNRRILSRDFFDIATIMKQEKQTIFDLLDNYRQHYATKLSPALILERLTQRDFDPNDPGLHPMEPKSNIVPSKFRQELATHIKKQAQKETKTINAIVSTPSILAKYLDRKFGLSRMNLPQKLASIGVDTLVLKALKLGNYDIAYKDISGNTLLDHYLENDEMFSNVLHFATHVPDEWLQSRTFKRHNKDRLIAIENSVIRCALNTNNSAEKIERIAIKHRLDPKDLLEKIDAKRELINNASSMKSKGTQIKL